MKLIAAIILIFNNVNYENLPEHCYDIKNQNETIEWVKNTIGYHNPRLGNHQKTLEDLSNIFECPQQCYLNNEDVKNGKCQLSEKYIQRLIDFGCPNPESFSVDTFLTALNGPEISQAVQSFENQHSPLTEYDQKLYDHLKDLQTR